MVDEIKTDVHTQININGQEFELKHMSAEEGEKLYAALGTLKGHTKTDYTALADQVAQLTENFDTLLSLPLPSGYQNLQDAVTAALRAVQKGGGKLGSDVAPDLKNFWEKAKGTPGVGGLFSTMETGAKAADATADFSVGFLKPFSILFNPVDTVSDLAEGPTESLRKNFNFIGGKLDPKRAKAFGAAFAASVYAQTEAPYAPVETQIPQPEWTDNLLANVQHYWKVITNFLPSFITAIIPAIGKWKDNGFTNWSGAWAEAKTEAEAAKTAPVPTKDEILAENLKNKVADKVRPVAADILASADEIAGIKTAPLAKAIGEGQGTYQGKDGTWYAMTFKDGKPNSKPLMVDGKPMTGDQRESNAWEKTKSALMPMGEMTPAKGIGLAAGTLAAGDVAHGVARGALSKMVGAKNATSVAHEKIFKEAVALEKQAVEAVTVKPIKDIFGKVTGHTTPNLELAAKLEAEALVIRNNAKLVAKAAPLEARAALRSEFFGTKLSTLAESAAPLGKWDLLNRGGAAFGKGAGWAGSQALTALETGKVTKWGTKAVYAYDGIQGVNDLLTGDYKGVAENTAQIGGSWLGSKYAALGAEKLLINAAPGRAKLVVAGASILGMFGTRWLGGKAVETFVPDSKPVQNTVATDAENKQVMELSSILQQNGVNIAKTSEQAWQFVSVAPMEGTGPGAIAYKKRAIEQLKKDGVIDPAMAPEDQLIALGKLQQIQHIKETVMKRLDKQAGDHSVTMNIGMNTVVNSLELGSRFGKLGGLGSLAAKGTSMAPGAVNGALTLSGDFIDYVDAGFIHKDNKKAWRSSVKVMGGTVGMAGGAAVGAWAGAMAGATAGAALGTVVPGIGNVVGLVVGGLCGAAGAWLGSKGSGAAFDQIDEWTADKKAPVVQQHASVKPVAKPVTHVEPDAGIHAAVIDSTMQKKATFAVNGLKSKVSIGATNHPEAPVFKGQQAGQSIVRTNA